MQITIPTPNPKPRIDNYNTAIYALMLRRFGARRIHQVLMRQNVNISLSTVSRRVAELRAAERDGRVAELLTR